MALIKCKECKNNISDIVDTICPNCGFKVTDDYLQSYKSNKKNTSIIFFQVFCNVLIYILFIYLITSILSKNTYFNDFISILNTNIVINYMDLYLDLYFGDNIFEFLKLKSIYVIVPMITIFIFPLVLYFFKFTTKKATLIVILLSIVCIVLLLGSAYILAFFFAAAIAKIVAERNTVRVKGI